VAAHHFFFCVLLLTGVRLLHELKKKGSDHNAERRGGFVFLRQFFFQAVMHRHRTVYMSPPLMVKKNNSVGGHACASVCGSVRTPWRDVEKRREKKSTQTTGINAQRGRHSSVITCLDREIGRLDFFLISSYIHISPQSRLFSYFIFWKGWNFLSWASAFSLYIFDFFFGLMDLFCFHLEK
jgi:hypothetical protein